MELQYCRITYGTDFQGWELNVHVYDKMGVTHQLSNVARYIYDSGGSTKVKHACTVNIGKDRIVATNSTKSFTFKLATP